MVFVMIKTDEAVLVQKIGWGYLDSDSSWLVSMAIGVADHYRKSLGALRI